MHGCLRAELLACDLFCTPDGIRTCTPRRSPAPRSRSRSRSRGRGGGGGGGGGGGRLKGEACKWNPRGFGFIKPLDDKGDDVFCHVSVLTDGNCLREGDTVEYEVVYDDRKGKYRADKVTGARTEREEFRGGGGGGAVAKGCNMNETDQEGNSCLHIAAAQGSNEILRILLNAGAKITAKNKGGMTALALACVKVGNMEKLSWGGASADEAPPGLAVGRWVRATVTFTTNSKNAKEVSKGSLGVVAEIDEDCDACIDFEGLDANQWVLKSKFGSISVLSQEDVLKERAQREEVVAMLIAPTQATS